MYMGVLARQVDTEQDLGILWHHCIGLYDQGWKYHMSKIIWPGVVVHTYNPSTQEAGQVNL